MKWYVVKTGVGDYAPIHREPREWETLATEQTFEHRTLAMFWIDQERERIQERKVMRLRAICLATICAAMLALVLL